VCSIPDEQALVDITRKLGISFERREGRFIVLRIGKEKKNDNLQINGDDKEEKQQNAFKPMFEYYEVLAQLEFTSARRRMTTAVKLVSEEAYLKADKDNTTESSILNNNLQTEVILFTKGADDMILSRSIGGFF
jgi:magnesium-transporting ATPase (P-type)